MLVALLFAIAAPTQASAVCSFWTNSRGATYVTLHADPGGDGALYVYVDGVQTTWLSTQGRRFYVTSEAGAVVRGYSSDRRFLCSN